MLRLNTDSDNYPFSILYLPAGDYIRWSDTLEVITVDGDYEISYICMFVNNKSPTFSLSYNEQFVLPAIKEHFQLVKRHS